MGNYIEVDELWNYLGKDAFTKIRSEIVGTGNGTTSTWPLGHDNVISASETIYTDGTAVTSSAYSIDLDDGDVTGLTAGSDVVVTADYNYGDLPDSIVQNIISSSENELEKVTGRKFVNTTGEIEYLNVEDGQDVFFLRYYPAITLSSVSTNTSGTITDTPSWKSMTEGLGSDYLANSGDRDIGRIRFIDNKPLEGLDRLKVTYDHGYTTVPSLIKEFTILLAQRQMANSAIYKAIFKGQDNFTPVRLAEIETRIRELINLFKKNNIELV